jgi:predicted transcriptional regulator
MKINRLDILLLQLLNSNECVDKFGGMTISEMLEIGGLGCRNNVYLRLKSLLSEGLIEKGVIDNHADTYYLTGKGKQIISN